MEQTSEQTRHLIFVALRRTCHVVALEWTVTVILMAVERRNRKL